MMKLIAVGDIHLGRRPSRLPEELSHRARELGPAGAWKCLVSSAIQEQVYAVVLAGDVVERENDFFEAYRELYQGVKQLTDAGIQVLGVAGNHDVQVLPRLADQIPDFRMLGRNGSWEAFTIEAGGERLTLWGWSFPQARVRESPLTGRTFDLQPGVNLGLLHCDRDQSSSGYAPVTSRELEMTGLDGWLLGHIHKPDSLSPSSLCGYLGSIVGLDPSESGAHGPWLVTIDAGRIRQVEQWVLAPLRWESLQVDLTGIKEPEEARVRFLEALKKLDADLSAGPWSPEAVGLRVMLAGHSRFGEPAWTLLSQDAQEIISVGNGNIQYFIERLRTATQPEVSLEELAKRSDPPGLLARRLLLLEDVPKSSARQELLTKARRRLEARARDPQWNGLGVESLDEDSLVGWLRSAGTRLLDRMLAQREGDT